MLEFTALIAAARHAKTLANYIESGSMPRLLADIELEAARSSLSKAALAIDARGQVWNAIGQLETAYQAMSKTITEASRFKYAAFYFVTRPRGEELEAKAQFILCLMAVCYSYLGEMKLCEEHLGMATAAPRHQREDRNVRETVEYLVGAMINIVLFLPFIFPLAILFSLAGVRCFEPRISRDTSQYLIVQLRAALLPPSQPNVEDESG